MEKHKTVDDFIHAMNEEQEEQVRLLCTIITDTHPELTEHIKWNSPSYILDGADRITLSVRSKFPIAVVLHMGAARPENKAGDPVMDDPSGLIDWKSDTRGVITFTDVNDIKARRLQFATVLDRWLSIDTEPGTTVLG